jgi:hypothetical protein
VRNYKREVKYALLQRLWLFPALHTIPKGMESGTQLPCKETRKHRQSWPDQERTSMVPLGGTSKIEGLSPMVPAMIPRVHYGNSACSLLETVRPGQHQKSSQFLICGEKDLLQLQLNGIWKIMRSKKSHNIRATFAASCPSI